MNIAIILAGGTGTRLGGDIPKQYIEVAGKPIISYCLDKFEKHKLIDNIVVVASEMWQDYIMSWITKDNLKKVSGFAPAGSSRQHSIVNGMLKAKDIDSTITGSSVGHPIRSLRNSMTREYQRLEKEGVEFEKLERMTLGSLRRAVIEGDVMNGTVMAGQIAGMVNKEQTCREIITEMTTEAEAVIRQAYGRI